MQEGAAHSYLVLPDPSSAPLSGEPNLESLLCQGPVSLAQPFWQLETLGSGIDLFCLGLCGSSCGGCVSLVKRAMISAPAVGRRTEMARA